MHKENCQCCSCKSIRGEYKGKNNPFYGRTHTEKTKKLMSKNHADISGENNPFYGMQHSNKSKQKISKNSGRIGYWLGKTGKGTPGWQGGVSFEPYGIEFDNRLRNKIRRRDNYICQFCGISENGQNHDIHHIDYDKRNNENWNLITLCHSHNSKANINRNKWQLLFQTLQEIRLCRELNQ